MTTRLPGKGGVPTAGAPRGTPKGAPTTGAPKAGAPKGAPKTGAPKTGAPKGAPKTGAPKGAPKTGAPKGAPKAGAPKSQQHRSQENGFVTLRLYVAGKTPRSVLALSNLRKLCETYLRDRCRIEVLDLRDSPERAREQQVLAIPTLVRRLPTPMRKIIGDLSNVERVLVGLDIRIWPEES